MQNVSSAHAAVVLCPGGCACVKKLGVQGSYQRRISVFPLMGARAKTSPVCGCFCMARPRIRLVLEGFVACSVLVNRDAMQELCISDWLHTRTPQSWAVCCWNLAHAIRDATSLHALTTRSSQGRENAGGVIWTCRGAVLLARPKKSVELATPKEGIVVHTFERRYRVCSKLKMHVCSGISRCWPQLRKTCVGRVGSLSRLMVSTRRHERHTTVAPLSKRTCILRRSCEALDSHLVCVLRGLVHLLLLLDEVARRPRSKLAGSVQI